MDTGVYIVIFIAHLACVGYCQNIAVAKKFNAMKWGFGGLFFGVIALIAICGMPENK